MEQGGSNMTSITSALTTAMGTVRDDFFTSLAGILPIALAVVGAGLVITLGVKYFKKISNKA